MENKWIVLSIVLALVVGFGIGALIYADEDIVCDLCEICPEPEVVTEIEYLNNTIEINVGEKLLNASIDLFLLELDDEDDLDCGRNSYDVEELEVRKVYDAYSIWYNDEDEEIDFRVKLRYDDGDDRCYKVWNVHVIYEESEDPEFNYSEVI